MRNSVCFDCCSWWPLRVSGCKSHSFGWYLSLAPRICIWAKNDTNGKRNFLFRLHWHNKESCILQHGYNCHNLHTTLISVSFEEPTKPRLLHKAHSAAVQGCLLLRENNNAINSWLTLIIEKLLWLGNGNAMQHQQYLIQVLSTYSNLFNTITEFSWFLAFFSPELNSLEPQ